MCSLHEFWEALQFFVNVLNNPKVSSPILLSSQFSVIQTLVYPCWFVLGGHLKLDGFLYYIDELECLENGGINSQ